MSTLTPEMIAARKAAIPAERLSLKATYNAALTALDAEEADLEAALRVLSRFEGISPSEPQHREEGPPAPQPPDSTDPAPPAAVGRRPEGVPKLPELIMAVLREAHGNGISGMEPREIRSEIMKRWWPEVKENSVGSVAWRMWKNDQLTNHDGVNSLPDQAGQGSERLF